MKLEHPVSICGVGTVLPESEAQRVAAVAGREHKVLRVDLTREPLAARQNESRLRRASPLTVFMLEAAQQALGAAGAVDPSTLGVVAALHLGTIAWTHRFYEGVLKSGQRFASPNLFPETVFNSAASHIAAVIGVAGPCYTVVGDDSAWVTAIAVAACWLANGSAEHVLVIGGEEFDSLELDAYEQARWLRHDGRFVPSEGAGAVLLRRARADDAVRVVAVAEGFTYRNAAEARVAAEELFAEFPDVRDVCRTAEHKWLAPIEAQIHHDRKLVAPPPGPYRGEAFTASAAWDTIHAAGHVRETGQPLLLPVWGQSEQCSALLLAGKPLK